MDWKEEVRELVMGRCSDSDIEDYIDAHPDLNGREVWDYICELAAPEACKGCRHIQMSGMYPCDACSRNPKLRDFYEQRILADN